MVAARLRSQLEQPVALKASVTASAAAGQPQGVDLGPADAADVRSVARAWGGEEPLVATVVDDLIGAVEVPPWATWLLPEQWIGRHERSMQAVPTQAFDGELEIQMVASQLQSVDDIRVHGHVAAAPCTLHVLILPGSESGDDTVRWYISQQRTDRD